MVHFQQLLGRWQAYRRFATFQSFSGSGTAKKTSLPGSGTAKKTSLPGATATWFSLLRRHFLQMVMAKQHFVMMEMSYCFICYCWYCDWLIQCNSLFLYLFLELKWTELKIMNTTMNAANNKNEWINHSRPNVWEKKKHASPPSNTYFISTCGVSIKRDKINQSNERGEKKLAACVHSSTLCSSI